MPEKWTMYFCKPCEKYTRHEEFRCDVAHMFSHDLLYCTECGCVKWKEKLIIDSFEFDEEKMKAQLEVKDEMSPR